ncbi:MAG: hypothetical protein IKX54_05270, partial [Lachnospiraceae bacterium]|nr:hypothetical protein [Lachnospiraceae bacterium]
RINTCDASPVLRSAPTAASILACFARSEKCADSRINTRDASPVLRSAPTAVSILAMLRPF